jgi:DNA-binding CsgD family transcriptional regulator
MRIAEPGGWKCNLGLMNSPSHGDFGREEKRLFLALRPHMERALALFARLKRTESQKTIFEETLDRLLIGTFILDGSGSLIEVNRVGQLIAAQGKGLSIERERLVLSNPRDHARLTLAIGQALAYREGDSVACFVDALRIERSGGRPLSLLVRTVSDADQYQSEVSPALIVYACDPMQQEMAPKRFVAQLFGFNSSEASLAALLANGMTLAQAARELGITENTARTYSKRMFDKMGVRRQTELVRLILTGVAPLGRA